MLTDTIPPEEIVRICGGLSQPSRQLDELRKQGFWRARLGRDGKVILERPHYEAVCAGAVDPRSEHTVELVRPRVQPVNA